MLIAQQKKKENTAEYLLYMWQLEDIFRAVKFDMATIKTMFVDAASVDADTQREMYDWYDNICQMMINEHLEVSGHLQINKNVLDEMQEWHMVLKNADVSYQTIYYGAVNMLDELRKKTGNEQVTDVELCFNLLYMTMIMRMQQKPITPETTEAVKRITDLVRVLVKKIKQKEDEQLKNE